MAPTTAQGTSTSTTSWHYYSVSSSGTSLYYQLATGTSTGSTNGMQRRESERTRENSVRRGRTARRLVGLSRASDEVACDFVCRLACGQTHPLPWYCARGPRSILPQSSAPNFSTTCTTTRQKLGPASTVAKHYLLWFTCSGSRKGSLPLPLPTDLTTDRFSTHKQIGRVCDEVDFTGGSTDAPCTPYTPTHTPARLASSAVSAHAACRRCAETAFPVAVQLGDSNRAKRVVTVSEKADGLESRVSLSPVTFVNAATLVPHR